MKKKMKIKKTDLDKRILPKKKKPRIEMHHSKRERDQQCGGGRGVSRATGGGSGSGLLGLGLGRRRRRRLGIRRQWAVGGP